MTKRETDHEATAAPPAINPGYAAFQIAKALTAVEEHEDPATRERAREKAATWQSILTKIISGTLDYGSRTPVKDVPAWATLEVVTGGFATGQLLANGPLQDHECSQLEELALAADGSDRRVLNAYFVTEEGLAVLEERLQAGCYDVNIPEEGALLVVAWLVRNRHSDAARHVLEEISPYFAKLRFYPIPAEQPRRFGARVHLQDVAHTIRDLKAIRPNKRVLAQKEAVRIWAPHYDRIAALFLETVEDDWPCQKYAADWATRALALLGEYAVLRREHGLCGKPERTRGHVAQMRAFLARCATAPKSLTGREVGRIRLILHRYIQKRGYPESQKCAEARRRQQRNVGGPTFHEIASVVIPRLQVYTQDNGLDDLGNPSQAVTQAETLAFGVPEGTAIPTSIQHKVERCLNDTVAALVERGLITSAEVLARVLPQMTAGIRAAGIADATLRQLYAAVYRAFRRRRSLLLLNLEKQVRIEELPWIAAIDRFRSDNISDRDLAKQTLEEVAVLTISSFPQAILPNKLLQELRALTKTANLEIPLVDELAVELFTLRTTESTLMRCGGSRLRRKNRNAAGFGEGRPENHSRSSVRPVPASSLGNGTRFQTA
jgi:hypothetical protein